MSRPTLQKLGRVPSLFKNYLTVTSITFLFTCLLTSHSQGAEFKNNWIEIVGQKVVNRDGVTLGYVQDTAIDLEHGRYFGLIVRSGDFFGGKTQIIPPGATSENADLKSLFLDMSEAQYRNAPTVALSEDRGPPNMLRAAEVYRYFGQQPYFAPQLNTAPENNRKLVQLGYVMEGTKIIRLPVQNLQGQSLGHVKTLMYLDSRTGRFSGVVIGEKIVPPEALRYSFDHNVLRLNNHEQGFSDSTDFKFSSGGQYSTSGSPSRPGIPRPPLQQGNSARDKAITEQIISRVSANINLSHYAQNIQVGTVQGTATVRGRVQSQREKDQIEGYSLQAAGRGNVVNMLDVRPITTVDKAVDQNLR